MGSFQRGHFGIGGEQHLPGRGHQRDTAEVLPDVDAGIIGDTDGQLRTLGTGNSALQLRRMIAVFHRIYRIAAFVSVVPLIAQRTLAGHHDRDLEGDRVVIGAQWTVRLRLGIADLGADILGVLGEHDRLRRIIAADDAGFIRVEHVGSFVQLFPALAALFPVGDRVGFPVVARLVGMVAAAVAHAARVVGLALVAVEAVVLFANAFDALVADGAVQIVFIAVVAVGLAAVPVFGIGASIAQAATFADGCILGTGLALGAMLGRIGAIYAVAAAVAQVYTVPAGAAVRAQFAGIEMPIAHGAVFIRVARFAHMADLAILRTLGTAAAIITQIDTYSAGAAVGAVHIRIAGFALAAVGAAFGTLPAVVTAGAVAHAIEAHAAVFADIAVALVALQTLLSAALADIGTLKAFAAFFANGGNTVAAAIAVRTAVAKATGIFNVGPKVAQVAVGAIVKVIVAFQTEIMAFGIPVGAFFIFNALFASAAIVAEGDLLFALLVQQALAAALAGVAIVVVQAQVIRSLAAHAAAVFIIAQAAVCADLHVIRMLSVHGAHLPQL